MVSSWIDADGDDDVGDDVELVCLVDANTKLQLLLVLGSC